MTFRPRRVAHHRSKPLFVIDTNESLIVPPRTKFSGRSNQIAITNQNGHLSQTETDPVVQEAKELRDEDEVSKTNVEAKNGLKNHCVAMRSTSIVEVGHKKKTQEVVHARNWLDKNRWREKHVFEAKQKGTQYLRTRRKELI